MSDPRVLIAELMRLQGQANQVRAAGQQAMQQAAPGGRGFTVGLRLHRTPMPGRSPAGVIRAGQRAMLGEFDRIAK